MMWPLLGSLISGGASLLGGIFSNQQSAANTQAQINAQAVFQQDAERFNAEQAAENRAWQTQMSNTAYSRAANDMKNAGLNPMMMFGSGSAAATPGGAVASTSAPSVPMPQTTHPLARIGDSVRAAIDTLVTAKSVEKMAEEISNIKTQSNLNVASEGVRRAEQGLIRQKELTEKNETDVRGTEAIHQRLRTSQLRHSAREADSLLRLPDWAIDAKNYSKYSSDAVAPWASTAKDLIGTIRGFRTFNGAWDDLGVGSWRSGR